MRFTKMHGCGNDYIYVNCFDETVTDPPELARMLSDRHYGIGGDGLILIEPSDRADAYMHMFNRDGSEGSMCGNGIRCTARYIYDHGIISPDRDHAVIDTRAGIRTVRLNKEAGRIISLTADMGSVFCDPEMRETLVLPEMELAYYRADAGNPHAVFFIDDNPVLIRSSVKTNAPDRYGLKAPGLAGSSLLRIHIDETGPLIEQSDNFPNGVNAEFIEILSRDEINMRVWERGSGETLACGTGATASVYAGHVSGRLENEVTVHLAGGDLRITCDNVTGRCFMTGEAAEVFSGNIEI